MATVSPSSTPGHNDESDKTVADQANLVGSYSTPRPASLSSFSPSAQSFYALFESALDAIVVADDGGCYVAANPAACELFGLSHYELLGRTIADFTPASVDFQGAWQEFKQMRAERGEFTLQRPDGTLRIVEYAATANFLPHFHLSVLRDITAQKEAEQALYQLNQSLEQQVADRTDALSRANTDLQTLNQQLEASQKKYQTLFNVLPIGVSITNAKGHLVEVNPTAATIFQLSPRPTPEAGLIAPADPNSIILNLDLADETGWQVIHPDGRVMVPAEYASVQALEKNHLIQGQEQGIVLPDGTQRWLMVNAAPIPLDDYGVAIAYLDMTERKQIEIDLRVSEERLSMALNAAHMGIWDLNLETNTIIWSASLERLMGLEPGGFDGTFATVEAMMYPADRARVMEALRRCIDQGEDYDIEFRFVKPDGTLRWALSQGYVVRNAEGKALRMIGIDLDITDRKQAEAILRRQEQEFRALAENTPDCIMRCDRQFRFLYVNPAVTMLARLPASAFLGKTSEELGFPPETVKRWHSAMERAFVTGQEQFLEYEMVLEVGLRVFDSRVVPEFGMDGTVASVLVVVRDVTKLKQAQDALMRQAEREHTLRLITQDIRASLDLGDILSTAVQAVHRTLQADRTLIFRLNTDHSGRVIQEEVQPGFLSTLGVLQTDECFPAECYASYARGQARIVPNVALDTWSDCLANYMVQTAVRSKMVAPILHRQDDGRNRVWGLLITHACATHRRWQAEELDLLQQVAEQLAIAIQQSELHHQLQAANQELKRLSNTDALTQVANRRCFHATLTQVWQQAQRSSQVLSLILCDVDYFKAYNDTYGHPAGDTCLTAVAQALQRCINRATDCLARYGGEEFAIILPHTSARSALGLAQTMQRTIADLNISHSGHLNNTHVTLSFGIASTVPQIHSRLQALIDRADHALYQAKEQGRNQICVAP